MEKEWIPFLVPLLISLLASVIAAHLIVAHNERESFFELIERPGYYPALGWSTLIAWLNIVFAYWVNAKLVNKFRGMKKVELRIVCRFLVGVVCILALCVLMAAVYFACYRKHIGKTIYFSKYLLIICFMVTSLNSLFTALFFKKSNPEWFQPRKIVMRRRRKWLKKARFFAKRKSTSPVNLDKVLFYSLNRVNFVVLADGTEEVWPNSHEKTLELLSLDEYFYVTRGCIVKRSNIDEVLTASSHRKKLRLKVPEGKIIEVSQRRNSLFVLWWTGKLKPEHIPLLSNID